MKRLTEYLTSIVYSGGREMSSKLLLVGLHPEDYGRPVWDGVPGDNNAFAGLLWQELEALFSQAVLTRRQRMACTLYFRGLTWQEIGKAMGCARQTAWQYGREGFNRLESLPDRGWITAVVEAQGWEAVPYVLVGGKTTSNSHRSRGTTSSDE